MKNEREYSYIENKYNKPLKAWNKHVPFEDGVYTQAEKALSLPFVRAVSLMPDAHVGMGSTVGSVVVTEGAIVPSMVSVDIGCGMAILELGGIYADNIVGKEKKIFNAMSKAVPNGRSDNGGERDIGRWHDNKEAKEYFEREYKDKYDSLADKYIHLGKYGEKVTWEHLGTLGTGNHFLELSSDSEGRLYLVVHSGSRGMGARIGSVFMKLAKEECAKWHISLVDPDLAYLPHGTEYYSDYIKAIYLAQDFAKASRNFMLKYALEGITKVLGHPVGKGGEKFDCHHNYASIENHGGKNVIVTRKGACRARKGDKCIIPGSMGAQTFLVRGLQNDDSFHSCSHGAGRKMSRTQAIKQFSVEDHLKATEGVFCNKTKDVLDETPNAYKDISDVMRSQETLVKPYNVLKQIVCVKGV
jgi:tRNA-splicing ligase RtcB (3'-phosphate/5'-hydroxy nucleic acid ligase)